MVGDSLLDGPIDREQLLDLLAERISRVERSHPRRVAIDGFDASGKTTLAGELSAKLRELGCQVIQASIDGFHNPKAIRYRRGSTSAEGYFHDSFNYAAITSKLLIPLGQDGNRRCQTAAFDYRTDRTVEVPVIRAPDDAILVFDGIFLQRPEIARFWDISLYLDVTVDTVLERAESRYLKRNGQNQDSIDVDALRKRYHLRYIPGQQEYILSCHPKDKADIVIDNNDLSRPLLTSVRL